MPDVMVVMMEGGGETNVTRGKFERTKPFISFQFILKTNIFFNKEAEMNKFLSFVSYTLKLNITVNVNR